MFCKRLQAALFLDGWLVSKRDARWIWCEVWEVRSEGRRGNSYKYDICIFCVFIGVALRLAAVRQIGGQSNLRQIAAVDILAVNYARGSGKNPIIERMYLT